MSDSGKVDDLYKSEDHILLSARGKGGQGFPGVKEPGMLHNDITATWETQLILLKEVW